MSQAFNYARIQARCAAALTRAGQPSVLRRLGAATGDDWNPTFAAPTLVNIVATTYRPRLMPREGSLIDNRYLRALVRPEEGLVVNQDDRIAVGVVAADVDSNTEWLEIRDVQEFSPGGTVLFWELELRT